MFMSMAGRTTEKVTIKATRPATTVSAIRAGA